MNRKETYQNSPQFAEAWCNKGVAIYARAVSEYRPQDKNEAYEAFYEAIKLDPEMANSSILWDNIAVVLEILKYLKNTLL